MANIKILLFFNRLKSLKKRITERYIRRIGPLTAQYINIFFFDSFFVFYNEKGPKLQIKKIFNKNSSFYFGQLKNLCPSSSKTSKQLKIREFLLP